MDILAQEFRRLKSRRGQGIVEYLMMLAVVVGVSLVVGKMFKPQISGIFNNIMGQIARAAETVGGTGESLMPVWSRPIRSRSSSHTTFTS